MLRHAPRRDTSPSSTSGTAVARGTRVERGVHAGARSERFLVEVRRAPGLGGHGSLVLGLVFVAVVFLLPGGLARMRIRLAGG